MYTRDFQRKRAGAGDRWGGRGVFCDMRSEEGDRDGSGVGVDDLRRDGLWWMWRRIGDARLQLQTQMKWQDVVR